MSEPSGGLRLLQPQSAIDRVPGPVRPYTDAVALEVTSDDGMQSGGESDPHYFLVGATALNTVLSAVALARLAPPRTILDFGAGAGRVLRWLRAAYPEAALTACDLREQDMRFCAERFGAETFISGTDIPALTTPGNFDLIWVGSVFTHLPPQSCAQLLDKFMSWCAPDGLVVFSTMGRLPASNPDGPSDYHYKSWDQIVRDYARDGFGYAAYDGTPGYGLAVTKPSWYLRAIEANPNVRLVMFGEAIWDNHHDVWAVQNRPVETMFSKDYGLRAGTSAQLGNPNFFADHHRRSSGGLKTSLRRLLGS